MLGEELAVYMRDVGTAVRKIVAGCGGIGAFSMMYHTSHGVTKYRNQTCALFER